MDGTPNQTAPRRRPAVRRTLWLLPVAGIAAASALGGLVGSAKSTPIDRTSETLQCTNGALDTTGATPARSFSLTARRGQIATADGNSVPMWGFADGDGAYQYPSPFLCANEGEDVTIALRNDLGVTQTGSGTVAAATSSTTLPIPGGAAGQQVTVGGAIYNVVSATATDVTLDGTVTVVAATPYVIGNPIRTSLMLPGMNGVLSDGSPATPEFVAGTPASGVQSLIQSVNNGETISYTFNAGRAGSFLYESGTNSATQIQMGLFGGLVVHAAAYSDLATGAIGRIFTPRV